MDKRQEDEEWVACEDCSQITHPYDIMEIERDGQTIYLCVDCWIDEMAHRLAAKKP